MLWLWVNCAAQTVANIETTRGGWGLGRSNQDRTVGWYDLGFVVRIYMRLAVALHCLLVYVINMNAYTSLSTCCGSMPRAGEP